MELTDRQVAHILAALRFSQLPEHDITEMPHFDGARPLNDDGVDYLCEAISCGGPVPARYTVVGLYPDYMWDGDMHNGSFVVFVEAENHIEAAQAARVMVARSRILADGEEEDEDTAGEIEEIVSGLAVLAIFPGHFMDEYDPQDEPPQETAEGGDNDEDG
jgi:hypothetical protein